MYYTANGQRTKVSKYCNLQISPAIIQRKRLDRSSEEQLISPNSFHLYDPCRSRVVIGQIRYPALKITSTWVAQLRPCYTAPPYRTRILWTRIGSVRAYGRRGAYDKKPGCIRKDRLRELATFHTGIGSVSLTITQQCRCRLRLTWRSQRKKERVAATPACSCRDSERLWRARLRALSRSM